MHANCGHCHNDVGPLQKQTALRLRVLTSETTVPSTGVYRTAPGLVMKHVVPPDVTLALVPGDADHSGIAVRPEHRNDPWQMPPVCTKVVDDAGVSTLRAWIDGLDAGAD